MEKQRKIILEPNGYYGGFSTNANNKIMIEIKKYAVGIREGLDPSYSANDKTTFENAEEAFKFIFDNILVVENFTAFEDGELYISCFKDDKNAKLGGTVETKETNKDTIKELEQYFHWCVVRKEYKNRRFTVSAKMINGDLLEIDYTPADYNQHSDDNRIEINLNDKNIAITSFGLDEDYTSVRKEVLENLKSVLDIEDGINKGN